MTLALLLTAVTGAWASGEIVVTVTAADLQADLSNPFTKNGVTIKCSDRMSGGLAFNELHEMSTTLGYFTKIEITNQYPEGISGINGVNGFSVNGSVATWTGKASSVGLGNYSVGPVVQFVFTIEPAGIDVTYNDAHTEASFQMPQYDVTATYTLKRDLSVETQVTVGDDHSAQPRYRVQKQGDTFQPYGMTTADVMALFHVHDQIENEDLTAVQDYTVQIYAVDIEGQPTGEAITFQNFTYAPGQYIVKAQGQGNYVGQTTESNVFTLYQGYPVEIAAQSFATYYSDDEALTLEESFAETAGLYTVASVTATEAVLSEKIDVMPKRTPMLIYNESETAQQILLIPTADVAPLTDVADEFKGTAVEKEVTAAEVAATNFYVLTDQNQFVWVKDAGTIAAHRCWLEIAPSQAAGARRIVFSGSGTTGISTTDYTDYTDGTFYDLNGRKFIKKPTKKGIYIQNGKKVVVK